MTDNQNLIIERAAILIAATIYLLVFNVELPHGDALRIVAQIQDNSLQWNPNHLLLDPIGYGWYKLLNYVGYSIEPLNSFEFISSISTIVSLFIFHLLLLEAGIKQWNIRIIAVVGLFGAKNFLHLAVTQYYFMVQMPFLLGALIYAVRYLSATTSEQRSTKYLYFIGILLAISTGIEANNLLTVILAGFFIGFYSKDNFKWNWKNTANIWIAAALTGIPIFILGYLASGVDRSFFSWALTYSGADNSSYSQLYGLQPTVNGILVSLSRVAYNLSFGNFIETAGLGIVLKSLISNEPLQFSPEIANITLALLLIPIVICLQGILFIWSLFQFKRNKIILFLFAWVVSYLIFAFLWNDGGSIFWFQSLPAIILLFAIFISTNNAPGSHNIYITRYSNKLSWLTGATAILLVILNTLQIVIPVSFIDLEQKIAEHQSLLKNGDLEITTGWDKYKWMSESTSDLNYKRLMLMNMALTSLDDKEHIQNLTTIVNNHLSSGHRVIVARLYDLDSEPNPWDNLAKMKWGRKNIQDLLVGFCNRKIATIDDVVFREIYLCKNTSNPE